MGQTDGIEGKINRRDFNTKIKQLGRLLVVWKFLSRNFLILRVRSLYGRGEVKMRAESKSVILSKDEGFFPCTRVKLPLATSAAQAGLTFIKQKDFNII